MEKFLEALSQELMAAFEAEGYEAALGRVTVSNRPDLCEFQCNGAMAGAKKYHKAPMQIATDVAKHLTGSKTFSKFEVVMPGFMNMDVSPEFVCNYVTAMSADGQFGVPKPESRRKVVLDFGGPNVAKPLHVGHLRSAVIGESIKRILRFCGHEVIGDIHLGDWGLPIGLVISEIEVRKPDLVYFDENFTGEYPEESPVTVSELEEIYPFASAKSKEDEEFKEKALKATFELQAGRRGYRALWHHIMAVSVADLKKNYDRLRVEFDVWKGESDVSDMIPPMIEDMKKSGIAEFSEGAWVINVKEETDSKEIPPCILLKSNGATNYDSTDVATVMERMQLYNPTDIVYVVDKRQDLHFVQCFRAVRKAGITDDSVNLQFIGFGTMNGPDGKPFKTREGGVMRLERLVNEINDAMYQKIKENREISEEEAQKTAEIVGLAALKYGDLSNQATKDYVFDIDRFTSSEGETGPYILYTIVRIKSILNKFAEAGGSLEGLKLRPSCGVSEKNLNLQLAQFSTMIQSALEDLAPHKVCSYVYDLANAFNSFYHDNRIMTEEDKEKQKGWLALLLLTKKVMEQCIDLLGFTAPDRM